MNIEEDIKPVTYFKAHTAEVLKKVNRTRRPTVITQNGEPCAVVQDAKSYEEMRQAVGLMKILAQGERDIENRKTVPQAALFAKLRRKWERK